MERHRLPNAGGAGARRAEPSYLWPEILAHGAGVRQVPDRSPAAALAGGWLQFDAVRIGARGADGRGAWSAPRPLSEAAEPAGAAAVLNRLTAPRPALLGMSLDRPRIMGILNVTPDSFSDGGLHLAPERAVAAGLEMAEAGADILDIGGESTRPGAQTVPDAEELDRVLPVIEGLVAAGCPAPISIDTRKAAVARAAFAAGARLFNDVSALTHDPAAAEAAAALLRRHDGWLCLVHAQGDPRTMQIAPRYVDVLLDVYDGLAERLAMAVAAGAPAERILIDPGIGFGKTGGHNLALLRRLGLLHGLGAPILLGASRKRFIGAITGQSAARRRGPGSVAAAIAAAAQGAQVIRVHDVAETAQALAVWRAIALGAPEMEPHLDLAAGPAEG